MGMLKNRIRMTHRVVGSVSDPEEGDNAGEEEEKEGVRCRWVGTLRNRMTWSR